MPRRTLLVFALLGLSGCSAVAALDRAASPQAVHELRAPREVPTRPASPLHLVVEVPATGGALSTERILVRPGGTQVAYLPDVRWSAAAPEMIQTAMIEAFLRSGAFAFVGRRPLGPSGDLALVTTLVDFGAVVTEEAEQGEGATIRMTLVAALVRERDAEIVASRTFSTTARAPDTTTDTVVAGYSRAADAVLTELVRWALSAAF